MATFQRSNTSSPRFRRSQGFGFAFGLSGALLLAMSSGCESGGKEDAQATVAPTEAKVEAPPAYVLQPQLKFADGEAGLYGTAFVVEHAGKVSIVTSSNYVDTSGPALKEFTLYKLAKGVEQDVATGDSSWGVPGRGGVDYPINDLRGDFLAVPLDEAPEGVQVLSLDDRELPALGEKVWLPNKNHKAKEGHDRIGGVVTDVDPGYLEVTLDEAIEIQSQAGSPILTAEGDKVIGLVSRGTSEEGKLRLWLSPGAHIRRQLSQDLAAVEQPLATVFPGADAVSPSRPLEFKFAWPEGLAADVSVENLFVRSEARATHSSSHKMTAAPGKKGWKIERTSLEVTASEGDGLVPTGASTDIAGLLLPGIEVGSDGRYKGVLDYRGFKKSLKAALADAEPRAKTSLSPLSKRRDLEKTLYMQWSEIVELWVSGQFKTGSVYRLDEEEIVPALGGKSIRFLRNVHFSDRIACNAKDVARECIRIDMVSDAVPESLQAAYEAARKAGSTPIDANAGEWPEFDAEAISLRTRFSVITRESTLVSHGIRRELVLQMPEGEGRTAVMSTRSETYDYGE